MTDSFATLGYGFHLSETHFMLNHAAANQSRDFVRDACISGWPQASKTNKEKMWSHLAKRYLDIDQGTIRQTSYLKLYRKLQYSESIIDLIFYQFCQSAPLLLQVLRSLARDALVHTGQARFTKYHLDQILANIFGRVTKSTSERVRQILREAGRLQLEKKEYIATSYVPIDAVLAYGLYNDAEHWGWRAPSSQTVMDAADVTATFLCTRPLLLQGIQRLAEQGHIEYHRHGNTDQIQLVYSSLEEFVNAWH